MQLRELTLERFGPFQRYKISFPEDDRVTVLLTGRNNEGKSNILLGLKLLEAGAKVVNQSRQAFVLDGKTFYRLRRTDVAGLTLGRLIHNYGEDRAVVRARFSGNFELSVIIDPTEQDFYADYSGVIPPHLGKLFGFVPPLGPLAEEEELLSERHLHNSVNTSLSPRHFRNQAAQLLSDDEQALFRELVSQTWPEVSIGKIEYDVGTNRYSCFFKEGRFEREIAWAGQGLQIWLQILLHMVRLRESAILILDEPEVNLHPEKQNDLVRVLHEHHFGSVIVATHSVELMNNVNVSHIVHVQKRTTQPRIKDTSDRAYLNIVRSEIGSGFNLVASQFEHVDLVLFTEDQFDADILIDLGAAFGIHRKTFQIPLYGFSEHRKCIAYRDAYRLLIGKEGTKFVCVLDRDYYPTAYLDGIQAKLSSGGVQVVYTPGKEIENLFLDPEMLLSLVPEQDRSEWLEFWESLFVKHYDDSLGSCVKLHLEFTDPRPDMKTCLASAKAWLDRGWNDPELRHLYLPGKAALKDIRRWHQEKYRRTITQKGLEAAIADIGAPELRKWLREALAL
jgi:hypothetical protein